MGRASFALLFLPLAVHVVVGQLQVGPRALPPQREIIVSTDRVDRLERWVKAVDQHEPGELDDAASEIGRFSETALRDLWVDAQSFVGLLRDRKTSVFQAPSGASSVRTRILYKPADLRRMRVLACAAAGLLDDRDCVAIDAKGALDGQGARLAEHAATSREAGDEDNDILRRAVRTIGPQFRTPRTMDVAAVRSALNLAHWNGQTALVDGVYAAMIPGESETSRALQLVFSDGLDTAGLEGV